MTDFTVPPGMPLAVWRDKYARRKPDGSYQTWAERVEEMVDGNVLLGPGYPQEKAERFLDLARRGILPLSGRHLQHGDATQPGRQAEYFYNCSSAMFSFMVFLLLMRGSGVGRDYSSDMCWTDWDYLPECRFVLAGPDKDGSGGHPDYHPWIESVDEARHKYGEESEGVRWFNVEDSSEGWARVVMIMETAAFHKHNAETVFVFDFSAVRPAGSPVAGQQGRPASGPVPLIKALLQVMTIKGAGMRPWKQALFIDHYLATAVVAGGVRRSARLAAKSCYDRDVIEFIDIKRSGYLWSANNSILVDAAFWERASDPRPSRERRVFEAAAASSYWDDTGEPGFINADKLNNHEEDLDTITPETYFSESFVERMGGMHPRTRDMVAYHLDRAKRKRYKYVVNPCGEISLAVWGGYCDIGDICLANVKTEQEAIDAAELCASALVRVNKMDAIYEAETARTNRIGVSLTGIHEFAWRVYGLSFHDLIHPDSPLHFSTAVGVKNFWNLISNMRITAMTSACLEAQRLGMNNPASITCIKPSGTVSKVLNCTEGAHLPATRHYLRWVLFSQNDPKVEEHRHAGYPVKDVSHRYSGYVVIGFPTCLPIVEEMYWAKLVTAVEASVEEQYEWLRLLEQHWLGEPGDNNQISYTLKWRKSDLPYEAYIAALLREQPTVRCCALMPELEQDASAYAYLPEEPINEEDYRALIARITPLEEEAYDGKTLICEGGACPIEENIR